MTRKEVFEYCRQQYKTEPDYPWHDWNAVLRHSDNGKWYGLVMEVDRGKIGLDGEGEVDILNVKCDPVFASYLRRQPGFSPAYHMNKTQWLSALLEESLNDETVKRLIDWSFQATAVKKKEYNRSEGTRYNKKLKTARKA